MPYVDYDYYQNVFGSNQIDEASFLSLSVRAEAFLDQIICKSDFDRLDNIKNAVCALCEVLYSYVGREGISKESSDGYSVTFQTKDFRQRLYQTARLFVPGELLYRGLSRCGPTW